MKTNLREFQRNFRAMRERAKSGEEILVQESAGVMYSFTMRREKAATFGDGAADIAGSFDSGVGDLASNPKHLRGYGGR
ncbi:MAG: hypothetical protein ACREKL_14250 [Chthoniobacterales bacterium]